MKFLKENTNTLTDKLDLSDNLKSFLVSSDFKQRLNDYDIDNIYKYISSRSFSTKDIRSLTQILYSIDVNPLNYLTYVPSYFLLDIDSTINISIPNNITSIGDYAFYHCSGLVGISIPDSVTTIGRCAFDSCSKLTKIVIPDSVTSIEREAFWGCSDLHTITINSNITEINDGFAQVCENLTEVFIPKTVLIIGSYSFSDCPSLREIHYNGTKQGWRKIKKHRTWKTASPIETIHCIDGDINYKVV